MRAHIESGNVSGLYTVYLEDGRAFHDRDAFQVQDLIQRFGLVEAIRPRAERAATMIEIVRGELGAGVEVAWKAINNEIVLSLVHGGREHETTVKELDDDAARAQAWCREILRSS